MIEKNIENGILGKCEKNKAGDYFVKLMRDGGSIITVKARQVRGGDGVPFPSMVKLTMLNCEQKFSKFDDSFWTAEAVSVDVHKAS